VIARRLDRVLVSGDLLFDVGHYRSWVELPFIYDHAPILFQLDLPPLYKYYPFKLNAQWLKDRDFVDLIFKIWKDPVFQFEVGKQHRIVWKLKILKSQTKLLFKEKLARNKEKLVTLESYIKDLILLLASNPTNLEIELSLGQMKSERNNILKGIEEQWRLCNRAIWMASGDSNTNFFHNCATHNRAQKKSWEIMDTTGVNITDQVAIKEATTHHFKIFYKDQHSSNTIEQLKIIELFPQIVNEDESCTLYNLVTLEELKSVLFLFKKDKSPGSDD